MQLTQQTDLGLRLLIILARSDGMPVSVARCASDQNVSYNHLTKVAQALAKGGFIESTRGRSGGVRLKRAAGAITIGEVVRHLEPHMRLTDCATCRLRPTCQLEGLLCDALNAFLGALDGKTLADMIGRDVRPALAGGMGSAV